MHVHSTLNHAGVEGAAQHRATVTGVVRGRPRTSTQGTQTDDEDNGGGLQLPASHAGVDAGTQSAGASAGASGRGARPRASSISRESQTPVWDGFQDSPALQWERQQLMAPLQRVGNNGKGWFANTMWFLGQFCSGEVLVSYFTTLYAIVDRFKCVYGIWLVRGPLCRNR